MDPIPDNFGFADLLRKPELMRDLLRFHRQMLNIDVIQADGNIKRIQVAPKSLNAILDLRSATTAISARRPPPAAPIVVPTLELWLKADSLVALNDGDSVAAWQDSSSYGRHVTASGSARPIYKTGVLAGKPGVVFDGFNDILTNAAGKNFSDCTIFYVAKQTGLGTHQTLFCWGNAAGSNVALGVSLHSDTLGPLLLSVNAAGGNYPVGGTLPRDGFHVVTLQYNGGALNSLASYSYLDNGVAVSTALAGPIGGSPLAGLCLGNFPGSTEGFAGYLMELVVVSESLGTSERDAWHNYLFGKYGLAGLASPDEPTEYEDPTEVANEEETESEADINRILTSRTGEVLVSRTGNVMLTRAS